MLASAAPNPRAYREGICTLHEPHCVTLPGRSEYNCCDGHSQYSGKTTFFEIFPSERAREIARNPDFHFRQSTVFGSLLRKLIRGIV